MIKFDELNQTVIENFNGGEGEFRAKMSVDDNAKIMKITLNEGCSIGEHSHLNASEFMYILEGEATCLIDGKTEIVRVGECHYCPKGSSHSVANKSQTPLVMFAVVAFQ